MNNKKYYPFERNNYFYGKLLSARDFQDEQKYVNDKRRINNFLTVGAGVVCGLNTIMVDEKTVSVEQGMALDYLGREIIVPESVTKKLNVIDGFEEITDFDNIYLCIEYLEKGIEKAHSIASESEESKTDYNRVDESYRLFLTDSAEDEENLSLNRFKSNKKIIYNKDGIRISQTIPKYVNSGQEIEITIKIEKINLPRILEVDYTIFSEYIKTQDGSNSLRIYYKDEDITAYKTVELKYRVKVGNAKKTKAKLNLEKTKSRISAGSVNYSFDSDITYEMEIIEENVNEYIINNYMKQHFDDVLNVGDKAVIYLSKFRLIKKEKEYYIEDFEAMPFKQFVISNSMLYMLMNNTVDSKAEKNFSDIYSEAAITMEEISEKSHIKTFSCGEEIIEIDLHSKNKSYISEELAHGLGKGNVLINVAVEDAIDKESTYELNKNVFGDLDVFEKSAYELKLPRLSTGVISYTDKGTFRIGIKFFEDAKVTNVKIKWWAYKKDIKEDFDFADINSVMVKIEPNTVNVAPREKYKFEAVVLGTDTQECRWSVTDKNGGQIDFNGVYEAPTQEGVYEIVAESVKYPNKKATAYVVVKKK